MHYPADIRPSEYLYLPETIEPSPVPKLHASSCPGHIFTPLLREGSTTKHILEVQDPLKGQVDEKFALIWDEPALRDTIQKDEELDADKDTFTIIAHDWSLKGVVDE